MQTDQIGVRQRNRVVLPVSTLARRMQAELAEDAAGDNGLDDSLHILKITLLVPIDGHIEAA